MRIILLIVSSLLCLSSYASTLYDTLDVSTVSSIAVGKQMRFYEDTTISLPPLQVLEKFLQGKGVIAHQPNPNFGIANSTFWAFFLVSNKSNQSKSYFIHIDNFLMDTTRCYEVEGESFLRFIGEAGDYIPFGTRVVQNRNILYPFQLAPGQTKSFLVSVFKDQSSISLPIKVWNQNAFYVKDTKETIAYGVYFGVLVLILIYSLFMFITLRKYFVLYYFLYVLFFGLFQLNHLGFAYEYLWPNLWFMSNYGFWMLGVAMIVFFIKFSQTFTRLKDVFKPLSIYFNIIVYLLITLLVAILSLHNLLSEYTTFAKTFYYYMLIGAIVGFVIMAIIMLRNATVEGNYFAIAFSALLSFGLVYILRELGFAPYNWFTQNALLMGSIVEILLFSLGIAHIIYLAYRERQSLAEKLQGQQEALMIATVEAEENERQRISSELHDSVGSQLSFLKVSLERSTATNNFDGIVEQIDGVANTVRRISHEMTPVVLKVDGLKAAVTNLVEKVNISSNTDFKLEWIDFPTNLPEIKTIAIYRIIQEAINNIIKHSESEKAYIQLLGYTDEVVLMVEDTGVGFDTDQASGFGLKNIENRVAQLKGTLDISSNKGEGASLVVSFPM